MKELWTITTLTKCIGGRRQWNLSCLDGGPPLIRLWLDGIELTGMTRQKRHFCVTKCSFFFIFLICLQRSRNNCEILLQWVLKNGVCQPPTQIIYHHVVQCTYIFLCYNTKAFCIEEFFVFKLEHKKLWPFGKGTKCNCILVPRIDIASILNFHFHLFRKLINILTFYAS